MANEHDHLVTRVKCNEESVSFDYYSCEEAVRRLNEYLDHELDPREREDVVKHLAMCKPCLERFHFEESLIIEIKTKMQKFCAPSDLKSRLSTIIQRR